MTLEHPSSAATWQPLIQIGDIGADQHWVRTPSGSIATSQVTWTVQDMTRREQGIPTYAIVLAVIFFLFCFLGLLFLLMKEDRTTGWLQVTVQGPAFVHTTQVPASNQVTVADIQARVNFARSLTAAAQH
jgi:hypothetical protein